MIHEETWLKHPIQKKQKQTLQTERNGSPTPNAQRATPILFSTQPKPTQYHNESQHTSNCLLLARLLARLCCRPQLLLSECPDTRHPFSPHSVHGDILSLNDPTFALRKHPPKKGSYIVLIYNTACVQITPHSSNHRSHYLSVWTLDICKRQEGAKQSCSQILEHVTRQDDTQNRHRQELIVKVGRAGRICKCELTGCLQCHLDAH